ncbi:MAG: DUF4430 domain-containing protein [Pirellulales bacterium]
MQPKVWLTAAVMTLVLATAVRLDGIRTARADEGAAKSTIELTIDYGDGVQKRFPRLPHRTGMTVLDALQDAQKLPRGIRFEHRGSGETAFVSKIDDLANEGRGKNWTYRVNDKRADRSCGVYPLVAQDRVLWKFGGAAED